ncbi:hypothetical protein BATDEDRAFT_90230 [Batrachochytrium dendrobatidis JAM81]|uniref:Uncharacterized protein n=2 Tax=Batrachochytrium dendrobatidis TaxID=109871 RepID=F4P735_BATDJ|nr:uncharacterized protein BATDEDRAFT_90230 [Batrachochytrium dendrobatidis JAM81]EGF78982.1 hypothetical protein BATDEDRAFT_90230 [Batrachochytrium dendrobatidis JAM81]KAJ8325441.1 hypothetical protein O5D80_006378 [Batrachochytrium dendrobatidis]KAK5670259.1 hypothetical protein QVD99_003274 [Batrachochytrium dendrobatidis]OAJ42461.1 hypothetical protein BDEG_25913 [Batrachochytrium dendrobatidis JEL423]|eukprot:XP_006680529.1 hypothetical protein BATDEDRAFT_90230 [Batrachochytrium dendrobatidis JAM81]
MDRYVLHYPKKSPHILPIFHCAQPRINALKQRRLLYLALFCMSVLLWTALVHSKPSYTINLKYQESSDTPSHVLSIKDHFKPLYSRRELHRKAEPIVLKKYAYKALSWERDLDITKAYVKQFRVGAPRGKLHDTIYIPKDQAKRRTQGQETKFSQSESDAALQVLLETPSPKELDDS